MEIELRTRGELRWRDRVLSGSRMRALFDALIARGGHACSVPELVDAIWDDDPPVHPKKALQILVARARRATVENIIVSDGAGYRLGLDPRAVDVLAQQRFLRDAQAAFASGDLETARALLRSARTVSPDLPPSGRRLAALIAARFDEPDAKSQLQSLIIDDETDEELLAAYFRALGRSQGPAHALQALAAHRERLGEGLGVSPGPLLQRVERELLGADDPVRHGLSHDATELLGRESDVATLRSLLEANRIVSIIGIGGLGKTRLARAVGRSSDRPVAHFVDLTAVGASDDLVVEIAARLELPGAPTQSGPRDALRTQIAQHLDRLPTLLILDNCEHIVEAVAEFAALLIASTRDLQVLTTTRTALDVLGEYRYNLSGLELGAAQKLFESRAQAARADVELPPKLVAQLVDQLERIPLAIELAAAKTRLMSVAEIVERLTDRFELLQGRARTAPKRHQTMFALLQWSWNLLTHPQRRALMTFALLPGGLTAPVAHGLLPDDGLAGLEALVEQSLLNVTEVSGAVRYQMFETVREFAQLQSERDPAASEAALAARANWAASYAAQHRAALHDRGQTAALAAVRAEEQNLTAAARHGLHTDDIERTLQILATLSWYWIITGQFQRVLRFFQLLDEKLGHWQIPASAREDGATALTALLIPQAFGLHISGRNLRAILEDLGPSRDIDPVRGFGEVLLAVDGNDVALSLKRLEEFGQDPDPNIALPALQGMAYVLENYGDPRGAAQVVERCLEISDPSGRPWPRVMLEVLLAQLHVQLGEHERAEHYARSVFERLRALGALEEMRVCQAIFAVTALHSGDFRAAEEEIAALETYDKQRGYLDSNVTMLGRAELALARGEIEEGLGLYEAWCQESSHRDQHGAMENPIFAPWILFSEATTLVACARFGKPPRGAQLYTALYDKLITLAENPVEQQDYPALGTAVFAVGAWGLLRGGLETERAVRLLGLAKAMSYNRISPSMAWEPIAGRAEEAAPGKLAEVAKQTRGKRGHLLLPDLRQVLGL